MRRLKRSLIVAIIITTYLWIQTDYWGAGRAQGERIKIAKIEIVDDTQLLGVKFAIINDTLLALLAGDSTTITTTSYGYQFSERRHGVWSDGVLRHKSYYSRGKANLQWGYEKREVVRIIAPLHSMLADSVAVTIVVKTEEKGKDGVTRRGQYAKRVVAPVPSKKKFRPL